MQTSKSKHRITGFYQLNETEDTPFYQAFDNDRKGTIFPLRVVDQVCETYDKNGKLTESRHANLMLTEKNGSQHYSTIAFCYRCLQGFGRQDLLAKHIVLCGDATARHVKMPVKGKNILKVHKHVTDNDNLTTHFIMEWKDERR